MNTALKNIFLLINLFGTQVINNIYVLETLCPLFRLSNFIAEYIVIHFVYIIVEL